LHTGIGHSQYSGLMSALNLPSLTLRNFEKREREAGGAIESVAKQLCAASTETERDLSVNDGQGEGPVAVGVSYDGIDKAWQKL